MKRIISIGVFFFALVVFLTPGINAQVPPLVNYQGRVAVDSVNFEGAGQFKFALVNSDGTTTFWSNDDTSAAGSEPAAAVTLTVEKGLYSVLLGDIKLGNMTAIPPSAFANPDVRLRVWFDDGVNGSQLLAPDQRLAPSAYLSDGAATTASIADSAVTTEKIAKGAVTGSTIAPSSIEGANIAPASLDFNHLTVPAEPTAGQVLGFDGMSLNWTAPGAGDGIWSLNGANAYRNTGNVGIGTMDPAVRLEVRTGTGFYGFLHSDGSTKLGSYIGSGPSAAIGGWFGTLSNHPLYLFVNNGQPIVTVSAGGMSAKGQTAFQTGGGGGDLFIGTPNSETGISIAGANRADVRFDGFTLKLLAASGTGVPASTNGIAINTSGNVGIGTTTPVAKLHVETSQANTAAAYGKATSNGGVGVYGQSALGPAVHAEGNATQARDKGGFVKAMAYIDPFLPASQYVVRCYNSQQAGSAMSTAPCGITVDRVFAGFYRIDFGFNVEDRFLSLTTDGSPFGPNGLVVGCISGASGNVVSVGFAEVANPDPETNADVRFYILVY